MASVNVEHYETTVYPQPNFVQHGNRRGAVLHCPMPECIFFCYHYVSYHSHVENFHKCKDCPSTFINKLNLHRCPTPNAQLGHIGGGQALNTTEFNEISRSHMGAMVTYRYNGDIDTLEVEEAFSQVDAPLTQLLSELWERHGSMKVEISLGILMERKQLNEDGSEYFQQEKAFFTSKHELHATGEIELILISSAAEIGQKVETFLEHGSQWYVKEILSVDIKIGEIRLFQNSRPEGWVALPWKKKGILNPYTKEPICFQLSVCISANYNAQRAKNAAAGLTRNNLKNVGTWRPYFKDFDWRDVMPHTDVYHGISAFEQRNGICCNIFTHYNNNKEIVLMRRSEAKFTKIVNLFLIVKKRKEKVVNTHFAGITNLSAFLGSAWKNRRVLFCQRCFRHFMCDSALKNHFVNCNGPNDFQPKEKMPAEGSVISFVRPEMTLEFPVVIYFDFECYSNPVCEKDRQKGRNTVLEYKYTPASYALCVAVQDAGTYNLAEVEYYDGDKPVQHFLRRSFELAEKYLNIIRRTNNFAQPTAEQLLEWERATECHLCHEKFQSADPPSSAWLPKIQWDDNDEAEFSSISSNEDNESEGDEESHTTAALRVSQQKVVKCYHHRHYDGAYQFPVCRACNLKIRYKHEVAVVCHGGGNFDFHVLLTNMTGSGVDFKNIKVLSKSSEKLIEIQMGNGRETLSPLRSSYSSENSAGYVAGNRKIRLRFIDNFNYLASSLSHLTTALSKDGCKFWHMLTQSLPAMLPHLDKYDPSHLQYVTQKLPYCYQYLSGPDKLQDGHPLPSREHWNNSLKNEIITDEEWGLVHEVCSALQIRDLRMFTRVYTIVDTVLLCIINTNFRSLCMEVFKLDPLYCPTLSGYSWQAFLFKTRASISHVRSPEIMKMVKDSIRGGLSFNSIRAANANNELLPTYNPEKERSYIIYYDINGLYAKALTQAYPVDNFQMEPLEKLNAIDWKRYRAADNNNKGFFLRVRLRYPESLMDFTRDLPLAPQRHSVRFEELPPFHQGIAKKLEGKIPKTFITQERLMAHCFTREDYVVYHEALSYYLNFGMELLEIKEGCSFTEAELFKPYVDFAIEMRRQARSSAMNSLLKLCVNALYGRSLMSNKERLEIKFADSAARARQLLAKPRCTGFKIINDHTSMIMLRPTTITLNNPLILGATCLDRAKILYYDAYYGVLKRIFGDKITMALTDTDSHICVIKDPQGEVLRKHIENQEFFDFSKIKPKCKLFSLYSDIPDLRTRNAGKNGLLKIESITISRAIFLKPKVYILEEADGSLEKRAKGVHRDVMKDVIFSTYESVHENDDVVYLTARMIRSFSHNLFNISVKKLGFHSLSVSRAFVSKNESLPFGHYKL